MKNENTKENKLEKRNVKQNGILISKTLLR